MKTIMRTLLATSAALFVLGAANLVARGAESEGFTITDDKLVHKKDFGPLAVSNPTATIADPTLEDCKDLPSDNAVKVTFKIKSSVPVKSIFTVTWPAPEGNDVDVYFFDEEGALLSDAATGDHPERFQVAGLPNGVYWVCVRNFSGANTGFTLEVKANFVALYERPPEPPTPKPTDAPPSKTVTTPEPTAAPPPPPPAVSPESVNTPGPDGSVKPQELFAVSGQRQAAEPEQGRSVLQIGLFALTGVIVAAGAGLVVVRIRRDTAA